MPSPLLHVATGTAICLLDRRSLHCLKWRHATPIVAAAVLPDLDFLPGFVLGDPNRFHGGCSHSLGFAAIAAVLVWLVTGLDKWRIVFWVFMSWTTHVLLDSLAADGRPPYGVPLFWPISDHTIHADSPWFVGIRHGHDGASSSEFLTEVVSLKNLHTLGTEAVIGATLVFVCAWIGKLAAKPSRVGANHP